MFRRCIDQAPSSEPHYDLKAQHGTGSERYISLRAAHSLLEHGRGDENVKIDTISSMSATIETLKHQVSYLQQLLRDAYTPLHMASIPHTEHLYRHIREQNDPAHEPLAGLY